jgi:hypothetical protein
MVSTSCLPIVYRGLRLVSGADSVQGIEAGERVLEYHPDFFSAHAAHLIIGQLINALTLKNDSAFTDATGRLEQTDDGLTCQGFARTGFSHDPKNLSRQDIKGYIVHRHQDAAAGVKFNSKMLNF